MSSSFRAVAASERALILEALLAIFLMNWWVAFEYTVLGTLAVMMGHSFKLSWAPERSWGWRAEKSSSRPLLMRHQGVVACRR
jgi:hypothetical protein